MNILRATAKFLFLCLLWQALEIIMYGEIQPRAVDDIIAFILYYYIVKGESNER